MGFAVGVTDKTLGANQVFAGDCSGAIDECFRTPVTCSIARREIHLEERQIARTFAFTCER